MRHFPGRRFGPISEWPSNRTESGRTVSSHPWQACCPPVQLWTVLLSGSAGHMPVARIRSFRSTSFRGTLLLESGFFVVGELSYDAARVTSREDSIGNVACDHAARADDRP